MKITGQGFNLRGWEKGDETSLQKHADNTHISDFLLDRFPSPYTLADAIGWIELMKEQNPVLNFAIEIEGHVAGVIGLEPGADVYRKTCLLGYWVSESYWDRGIAPRAVKLVCDYAFADLDMIRVQARVLSNNPKSMRVLEKAGFMKEGVMKSAVIKKGVILDEHLYALVKES